MNIKETGYDILFLRLKYHTNKKRRTLMKELLDVFIEQVKLTEKTAKEQGLIRG